MCHISHRAAPTIGLTIPLGFSLLLFLAFHDATDVSDALMFDTNIVTSEKLRLGSEGILQFHYIHPPNTKNDVESHTSCCDAIVMIHVGTAMSVEEYNDLGNEIVIHGSNTIASTVAIIIDASPSNIQKQNGRRIADFVNTIAKNVTSILPNCCLQQPKNGYLLGGHSGGGQGIVLALQHETLSFSVSGFIGLAPYNIAPSMKINIPSLNWGFSTMSCFVNPKHAALAAYNMSDPAHRVLYQIQTNNWNVLTGGPHCSFADNGCLSLCTEGKKFEWIRGDVGKTIELFLQAIHLGSFRREHFELRREDLSLFVNQDVPTIDNRHFILNSAVS